MGDFFKAEVALTEKTLPSEDDEVVKALATVNPELSQSLAALKSYRRAVFGEDAEPEDVVPIDFSMLLGFEYQGQRLKDRDILFIVNTLSGLREVTNRISAPDGTVKNNQGEEYSPALKPVVQAALHELTKNCRRRYQVSVDKVVRELLPMVESNITDVMDVTAAGMTLKDFSTLPRHLTAGVSEIQETRNAQGVQLRVKMHDKIAAIAQLTRLLGLNREKTTLQEVTININDRLSAALDRLKNVPAIEGEVVITQTLLEAPSARQE